MRWKGEGDIPSGDYTVYYSEGESAERGVAIVICANIVRSVFKNIVCNDRITTLRFKKHIKKFDSAGLLATVGV
jgi:hypothetical protein